MLVLKVPAYLQVLGLLVLAVHDNLSKAFQIGSQHLMRQRTSDLLIGQLDALALSVQSVRPLI
jgi:hypothetical protein